MGLQAPRFAFVEYYLNVDNQPLSAGDYQGVYMIVETIKNSKNRLDLKKLKEDDITPPNIEGGYIFKFEWMAAEEPTLPCAGADATCWHYLEVVDPDPLQPAQKTWLNQYVQQFHDMLHSPGFADPVTGYRSWIDVNSFVDRLIIGELSREMDSYIRSAYFYKDRGGKLFAGPLWDFDLSFGVGGFFNNTQTSGWQYEQIRQPVANDWLNILLRDPAFVNQVKGRWAQLRQGLLSNAQLEARIAGLAAPLANAAQSNFQRWPNLTTQQIGFFITPTAPTWQGQVDAMRTWLFQRVAWLDTTSAWGGGGSITVPPPPPSTPPVSTPTATPPVPGGRTCTATYSIVSQWTGGFQGSVRITAGSSAISGWRVSWTFANGQSISQAWEATVTSSGAAVTASNLSHNGALPAGGSATFGFLGSWTGANSVPTVSCTAS